MPSIFWSSNGSNPNGCSSSHSTATSKSHGSNNSSNMMRKKRIMRMQQRANLSSTGTAGITSVGSSESRSSSIRSLPNNLVRSVGGNHDPALSLSSSADFRMEATETSDGATSASSILSTPKLNLIHPSTAAPDTASSTTANFASPVPPALITPTASGSSPSASFHGGARRITSSVLDRDENEEMEDPRRAQRATMAGNVPTSVNATAAALDDGDHRSSRSSKSKSRIHPRYAYKLPESDMPPYGTSGTFPTSTDHPSHSKGDATEILVDSPQRVSPSSVASASVTSILADSLKAHPPRPAFGDETGMDPEEDSPDKLIHGPTAALPDVTPARHEELKPNASAVSGLRYSLSSGGLQQQDAMPTNQKLLGREACATKKVRIKESKVLWTKKSSASGSNGSQSGIVLSNSDAPSSTQNQQKNTVASGRSSSKLVSLPKEPTIKIFLLLLQPQCKIFEMIQLRYTPSTATIGDVLDLIPGNATEPALAKQIYVGLTRPKRRSTEWIDLAVRASENLNPIVAEREAVETAGIVHGEILVALPSGYPSKTVISLAKQILANPRIQQLLEKASPLAYSSRSSHLKRHRGTGGSGSNLNSLNGHNSHSGRRSGSGGPSDHVLHHSSCPALLEMVREEEPGTPSLDVSSTASVSGAVAKAVAYSHLRNEDNQEPDEYEEVMKRAMENAAATNAATEVAAIQAAAIGSSTKKKKKKNAAKTPSPEDGKKTKVATMRLARELSAETQGRDGDAGSIRSLNLRRVPQHQRLSWNGTGGDDQSHYSFTSVGSRRPTIQGQFEDNGGGDDAYYEDEDDEGSAGTLEGSYMSWSQSFDAAVSKRRSSMLLLAAKKKKSNRSVAQTKLLVLGMISVMMVRYLTNLTHHQHQHALLGAGTNIIQGYWASYHRQGPDIALGLTGLLYFGLTLAMLIKFQRYWILPVHVNWQESSCPFLQATAVAWERLEQQRRLAAASYNDRSPQGGKKPLPKNHRVRRRGSLRSNSHHSSSHNSDGDDLHHGDPYGDVSKNQNAKISSASSFTSSPLSSSRRLASARGFSSTSSLTSSPRRRQLKRVVVMTTTADANAT